MDFDHTEVVPFYGEAYFITKDARTADMDKLKKEVFQVMPMV